jgi:hypothetical protein
VLLVSADAARGHALEQAVERAVATVLHTRPLLAGGHDETTAIVPRPVWGPHDRWHDLYSAVAQRLRPAQCSIGVGGAATQPSGLRRSYEQARWALRMRQSPQARAGITPYDELGVYRLLACGEEAETRRFIREWLGVLIDYDKDNSSDLVETLRHHYEHGGNYDATARALVIYRSTLRYRLRRIRDLSGDRAVRQPSLHRLSPPRTRPGRAPDQGRAGSLRAVSEGPQPNRLRYAAANRPACTNPHRAATVPTLTLPGSAINSSVWIRSSRAARRCVIGGTPTVRANPSCRVRALTPTRAARQAVDHGRSGCSCMSSRACRTARGRRGVAPAASASL